MKETKIYHDDQIIETRQEPEFLIDYIKLGYTIVTSQKVATYLKPKRPNAIFISPDSDGIGGPKLLIDKRFSDGKGLKAALPKYKDEDIIYEDFTFEFIYGETSELAEPNLLEIKLKDMDAVPEVFYKGEKIFNERLVSINFEYETLNADDFGEQSIKIVGYDKDKKHAHPTIDTIEHRRA